MRKIAPLMALVVAAQAAAQTQPVRELAPMGVEITTITITAPRLGEQAALKTARTTGTAAAVGGAGLMAYVVFFNAAGPFGWAAALVFVGGMTVYLSHRRLQGQEDFPPTKKQAP